MQGGREQGVLLVVWLQNPLSALCLYKSQMLYLQTPLPEPLISEHVSVPSPHQIRRRWSEGRTNFPSVFIREVL